MRHLFICSTPLQLFHVINLKLNKFPLDTGVLYILNHNKVYESMYKKALETDLFEKVILVKVASYNKWSRTNSDKSKFHRLYVKLFEFIFYKQITKYYVKDNLKYDYLWVSCMDPSSWLIFMTHKKINKLLKINFFEDGIGGYMLLLNKQSSLELKLLNLLSWKGLYQEINSLYLLNPTLIIGSLYKNVAIEKLPLINNEKTKFILNKFFLNNKKEIEMFKYKYIFFDGPFDSDIVTREQLKIIDFFSNKLKDKFKVKLHPRTKLPTTNFEKSIIDIRIPTEVLCLNKDVSKNVFISIFSTVGITPKLIFGQEPILIFLYKIIDIRYLIRNELYEFMNNFVKTYDQKDRVYIPKNIEELNLILDQLEED